ncbi:MAG: ABC transporter ATP-binding protein [Bryobacterales bacterium]|nr:ABC transporter ATP-binding protein [Bryobacterales bacterium]
MSISSGKAVPVNAARKDGAEALIAFEGVSKRFQRHGGQSLLRHFAGRVFGSGDAEPFYALRDVSFSLSRGESLAVIGRNGAGKSTLLSLVAGLCQPEQGKVTVRGTVGALLELGTGFHPDLTGRENLHLNAALVGFSRRETLDAEPAIIEFAELADFIDEPIRTYSQGMTMRLAFSIAVHSRPDILMVDEVLAVGDARFQARCRERIFALRDAGCTFLFVSHAPRDVTEFCRRAILLEGGRVMADGAADDVLGEYQRASGSRCD